MWRLAIKYEEIILAFKPDQASIRKNLNAVVIKDPLLLTQGRPQAEQVFHRNIPNSIYRVCRGNIEKNFRVSNGSLLKSKYGACKVTANFSMNATAPPGRMIISES